MGDMSLSELPVRLQGSENGVVGPDCSLSRGTSSAMRQRKEANGSELKEILSDAFCFQAQRSR